MLVYSVLIVAATFVSSASVFCLFFKQIFAGVLFWTTLLGSFISNYLFNTYSTLIPFKSKRKRKRERKGGIDPFRLLPTD